MKKTIAILLVAAAMILCLTGCMGKKATAVVTFDGFESATLASFTPNTSVGLERNVLTVNVTREGVYPIAINVDGTIYHFILTYENGTFTGEADEGLTFSIK